MGQTTELDDGGAPGSPAHGDRLARAFALIDAANADDPHTIEVRGRTRPKEQAHAELMVEWVRRLDPDPDDAQLLAARAHHLRRWSIPRADYPEGRAGYLRWRRTLNRQHAQEVAGLLAEAGYGQETVEVVQRTIRKEGLVRDPRVQLHEDALCLVFLETQLGPVADQLGPDKGPEVLVKTVAKMTERGRRAAMALDLPAEQAALVASALAQVEAGS